MLYNPVEALMISNCLNCDYNCDDHISIPTVQINFISRLIPVTGSVKMNSINWSAPNIWVFIPQLVTDVLITFVEAMFRVK